MSRSAALGYARAMRPSPTGASRSWSLASVIPSWWPLTLVLVLQALVALIALRNSAFQDEGLYLYAGGQILHYWMGGPAPVEHYAYYFSGYPYMYPVIGGALDSLGGLELARAFSLACMLGVTTLVYVCTLRLFQQTAAFFACATYAFLGAVLYVSRLATFDALCLLLIALAAAVAMRAATERHLRGAFTLGPILVVAVLTKYAALLFIPPVLGLLAATTLTFAGWRPMVGRLSVAIFSLCFSLFVAVVFLDPAAFHAIVHSTTSRVPGLEAPRLEMIKRLLYMGGVVYGLGLAGLVLVWQRHTGYRLIALVLFGSSLLIPTYHIYEQEVISFDKHLAYGLFFVAPLAGYAVARLAGEARGSLASVRGYHGLPGLAAVLIVFILGLQQSQWIYSSWADSSALSAVLHTQLRDGSGRYLAEDIEVSRYDAGDVTEAWQWNGPYYFSYETSDHKQLYGDQALTKEIQDRYFAIVELSFVYQPNTAFFIAQQMAYSRNYDLIAVVPYQNSFGTGHYFIWRSALVAGHGNFTGLAQLGL